jgi:hypothetical protein
MTLARPQIDDHPDEVQSRKPGSRGLRVLVRVEENVLSVLREVAADDPEVLSVRIDSGLSSCTRERDHADRCTEPQRTPKDSVAVHGPMHRPLPARV